MGCNISWFECLPQENILILLEMGLISFEYNTHLLQGKKSSKDELGRIFFFGPGPTQSSQWSQIQELHSINISGGEKPTKLPSILLGLDLQDQRICSSKVVGAIVKENRFLQNMKNSWVFEQILLPALMLIFPCQVFSSRIARGSGSVIFMRAAFLYTWRLLHREVWDGFFP